MSHSIVAGCPREHFLDPHTFRCMHCDNVCDAGRKTPEQCKIHCPEYMKHPDKDLIPTTRPRTSTTVGTTLCTTPAAAAAAIQSLEVHLSLIIMSFMILVMIIILLAIYIAVKAKLGYTFDKKRCVAEEAGLTKLNGVDKDSHRKPKYQTKKDHKNCVFSTVFKLDPWCCFNNRTEISTKECGNSEKTGKISRSIRCTEESLPSTRLITDLNNSSEYSIEQGQKPHAKTGDRDMFENINREDINNSVTAPKTRIFSAPSDDYSSNDDNPGYLHNQTEQHGKSLTDHEDATCNQVMPIQSSISDPDLHAQHLEGPEAASPFYQRTISIEAVIESSSRCLSIRDLCLCTDVYSDSVTGQETGHGRLEQPRYFGMSREDDALSISDSCASGELDLRSDAEEHSPRRWEASAALVQDQLTRSEDKHTEYQNVMKLYHAVEALLHVFPWIVGCVISNERLEVVVSPERHMTDLSAAELKLQERTPRNLHKYLYMTQDGVSFVPYCGSYDAGCTVWKKDAVSSADRNRIGAKIIAMWRVLHGWYAMTVGHFLEAREQVEVGCSCESSQLIDGVCEVVIDPTKHSSGDHHGMMRLKPGTGLFDSALVKLNMVRGEAPSNTDVDKYSITIDRQTRSPEDEKFSLGNSVLVHRDGDNQPLSAKIAKIHAIKAHEMFTVNMIELASLDDTQSVSVSPGQSGSLVTWLPTTDGDTIAFAYLVGSRDTLVESSDHCGPDSLLALPLWANMQELFTRYPEYREIDKLGTLGNHHHESGYFSV